MSDQADKDKANKEKKDVAAKKEAEKKGAEESDSLAIILNWVSKKWEGVSKLFPESSSGNFAGKAMEFFSNLPSMFGSFFTSILKLAAPILSKFGINFDSDKEIADYGSGLAQLSIGHLVDKTAEAIKESEKPKKDDDRKPGSKDQKPEEKAEDKARPSTEGSATGNNGNGAATEQTEEQKAGEARLAAAEAKKEAEKPEERAGTAAQGLASNFNQNSNPTTAMLNMMKGAAEKVYNKISGIFGSAAEPSQKTVVTPSSAATGAIAGEEPTTFQKAVAEIKLPQGMDPITGYMPPRKIM